MRETYMTQIRNGIYGAFTADALGVSAEFKSREELQANPVTDMVGGGIHNQPVGTWSDDSSMTLCLMTSISQTKGIHTNDIMKRFLAWLENGEYSPWGECFDKGHTVMQALERYKEGVTPSLCGGNKEYCNGNGSLMRILPMAFFFYPGCGKNPADSGKAMETIHKVSGLTHRHPVAQSACGIYVNIACRLMDGMEVEEAVQEGICACLQWYRKHEKFAGVERTWSRIKNPESLKMLPEKQIYSSGYVVDTLEAALWCLLTTDNYRDCVLKAVNLGDDTDTTAAVAGGLAGLLYGYDGIPQSWIEKLAAKKMIDEACDSMAEVMYENYNQLKKYSGLDRFLTAQEYNYSDALREIKSGKKQTCWMWYVFPQIIGLGKSYMSVLYSIRDMQEAKKYVKHEILGKRLVEITGELLKLKTSDAYEVFGSPDNLKLQSSMTLFACAAPEEKLFQEVLDKFFYGEMCERTLQILFGK